MASTPPTPIVPQAPIAPIAGVHTSSISSGQLAQSVDTSINQIIAYVTQPSAVPFSTMTNITGSFTVGFNVLGTINQNTGETALFFILSYEQPSSGTLTLYSGSTTPPTSIVAANAGSGGTGTRFVCAMIPPNYYYAAKTDTAGTLIAAYTFA